MKIHLAVILASLLFCMAAPPAGGSQRPEQFGLALPFPRELPAFPSDLSLIRPGTLKLVWVPLVLSVDLSGNVTEISHNAGVDTLLVNYARPYLEALKFEPATRDGSAAAARLPVVLRYRRGVAFPSLTFPVSAGLNSVDHDLLEGAYRLNGIELPRPVVFPSFAGAVDKNDSSLVFPYILLKIELDRTGRLTAVEVVRSTLPDYNMPIESAAMWAEYAPAVVAGETVPSTGFLMVSFFPQLDYPLKRWDSARLAEISLMQRESVRLFADTVGLMFEPIPRRRDGDAYTLSARRRRSTDSINCYLSIDTLGFARVRAESKAGRSIKETMQQFRQVLRFYPALGFDGRPRPFYGFITLLQDSTTTVRVRYHWLKTH